MRAPGSWLLHAVAGAVVLVGVLAVVLRPLAPDLGAVPDPARWYDAEHLARVDAYRSPRYALALLGLALRVAIPCAVAFTPAGKRLVARMVDRLGGERHPVRAGTMVVVGVVVVVDLAVLPLNFWLGYVHDGIWGFRTQGLGGWARDWVVGAGPAWVVVAGASAVALVVARHLPRAWPAVVGTGGAVAAAGLVLLAPLVLEPLQHRTEPLPPGELRAEVERVAAASGQHVDEIVVADASRRTTRQNAYVSGLGATRRIVLYDTLVESRPARDVGMVLAHELAHHRHGDVLRGTLAAGAGLVLGSYVLHGVMRWRVATGRQRDLADPRGAVVALAIAVLLVNAVQPVAMSVSRHLEAAADLGALEISNDPETYLRQKENLGRANLTDPAPPQWVYLLWSSHPPTASRLEMGERWPLEWRGPVRPPPPAPAGQD